MQVTGVRVGKKVQCGGTRWQRFLVGAMVVVLCVTMPLIGFLTFDDGAFAAKRISEEELFINGLNGIYFYNPSESGSRGGKCPSGSYVSGPIAIVGSTVEEKIWNALIGFMTEEQAAGVMGNMEEESRFNPAMHEGDKRQQYPNFDIGNDASQSYGLGLAQWSYDRRVSMYHYVGDTDPNLLEFFDNPDVYSPNVSFSGEQFMAVAGENATDALLSLEIQYLKDDVAASYLALYDYDDVAGATEYWLKTYENPKDADLKLAGRVANAERIYNQFANGGAGASENDDGSENSGNSSGSSTVGTVCNTDAGELEEYVRKYAWPDFRKVQGVNYTNRMPDYADAVTKRQSEGKYVGGAVDGVAGIDCGGFVTTLMQESGYDPDYNGCGSNVATQEFWVREGGGSDKWEALNPNGETLDVADLQMGDVAFQGNYTGSCAPGGTHTYMFIGSIDGFETSVVSASYNNPDEGKNIGRAPMASYEEIEGARWYRKVK